MKLKRIFENKRRIAKQQFSKKGGRPKVEIVDEGPNAKKVRMDEGEGWFLFRDI
jgi:hypothetical protein